MKKSLFALAALGAFATAAQAQSTVTLYGTFDSSIALINGVANGVAATTTSATAAQTTGSSTSFIDGSFATSAWGMRGSEDLGGGMKANFHLESDLLTNNGNTHSDGLFRRAANVSISDAKLGELFLGRRGNAYIIATGAMLPVQGNTVHQWRSVIGSSIGDQVSNSVSYATPTIMATNVLVQYGLNNSWEKGDDGTTFGANLINKSIKDLTFSAAYNNMQASQYTNALAYTPSGTGANTAANLLTVTQLSSANPTVTNREGYAFGLKYRVNPAIEVGTLWAHGRYNTPTKASGTTLTSPTNTQATASVAAIGVGYQVTPAILLGANYARTSFAAAMTNLQAHYMLSKRTRVYSQITMTQKQTGNVQSGNLAAGAFSAIHCNSSTVTACSDVARTSGSTNNPVDAQAYNVGIIHSF
jgi:predicted porin